METYSFNCEAVTNNRQVKEIVAKYEREIKSPCYINLITDNGVKLYYTEKSNLSIEGAGWIVVEKYEVIGKIS
ncbi:hypothetical protein PAEVO_03980 [Paenibacillus sp. GM2FR]|nr:hypothetical protein PAEVO_03980 [Paenibacillus sp. GM2FR]